MKADNDGSGAGNWVGVTPELGYGVAARGGISARPPRAGAVALNFR
jgi:hypothetical protein